MLSIKLYNVLATIAIIIVAVIIVPARHVGGM